MIFLCKNVKNLNTIEECVSSSDLFVLIDYDKIVDIINYDKYMITNALTHCIYSNYGDYHRQIESIIPIIGHNYKCSCDNVLTEQEQQEAKAMRLMYSRNQILKYGWKSEITIHFLVYNLDEITEDIISYFSKILPKQEAYNVQDLSKDEIIKIVHKDVNEILTNLGYTEPPKFFVAENEVTANTVVPDNNRDEAEAIAEPESFINEPPHINNTSSIRFSFIDLSDGYYRDVIRDSLSTPMNAA